MAIAASTQAPGAAGSAGGPIIRFDQVALRLGGVSIFENLSFDVRQGEFVCVLGPSGCGKSTTLRLIGGLLPCDGGQLTVAGGVPRDAWQRLAYVFQSPRLLPWRNALANVRLGMEMRGLGLSDAAMQERAQQLLGFVGLGRDGHKFPRMLSGGERQRVAIARALAVEPDIILMDEPFSALDPNTRQRLRAELLRIWQATGKTVVFVTHDIDEALALADRVVLLSGKPTRVVEVLELHDPRPRGEGAEFTRQRARLHAAFSELDEEE